MHTARGLDPRQFGVRQAIEIMRFTNAYTNIQEIAGTKMRLGASGYRRHGTGAQKQATISGRRSAWPNSHALAA